MTSKLTTANFYCANYILVGVEAGLTTIVFEAGVYAHGIIFSGGANCGLIVGFNSKFYGELKVILFLEAGSLVFGAYYRILVIDIKLVCIPKRRMLFRWKKLFKKAIKFLLRVCLPRLNIYMSEKRDMFPPVKISAL